MRFGLLGATVVSDDQGRPLALVAPKQSAALVVLLLAANETVSNDRLIQQLRGDLQLLAGTEVGLSSLTVRCA
jgi:hypothetical protein